MTRYFFIIVLIGIVTIAAYSQTTEFTYQGSLKDSAAPASGYYDFEFALFDAASGSSQIGTTIPRNGIALANGIFAVKLDFGSVFPGADRYLEIRVRLADQPGITTLTPRQLLNSAPYSVQALRSASAAVADSVPASGVTGVLSASQGGTGVGPGFPPAGVYLRGNGAGWSLSGLSASDITGVVQVANGGTGSATQNFVDLTNAQAIAGNKTFSNTLSGNVVNATTQFNLGGTLALRRPNVSSLLAGTSGAPGISGVENTMFGQSTGSGVTTGSRNSLMGFLAGTSLTTANDNTAFGWRAGTTATSSGNSFFGSLAGGNNTAAGANNTFVGANADFDVTGAPGGNNTLLGANSKVDMTGAGQDISFATAVGSGAAVQFSDMVMLGKAAGTYNGVSRPADIVRTAGIFQPALSSPGGSPVCFNNGLSLCSSSRRYKFDIMSYSPGLEIVRRLEPVTFSWISNGKRDIGFIAEDVHRVEPLLTFNNQADQLEGVHYAQITTVLVNAVKEQQAQIEAQSELIKTQQTEIEVLKVKASEVEALKRLVCSQNSTVALCRSRN